MFPPSCSPTLRPPPVAKSSSSCPLTPTHPRTLPGPYVDTFSAKLGLDEFVNLLEPYEDKTAIAEAAVGFSHGAGCAVRNFTGRTDGMIVEPRHTEFFNGRPIDTGWDPIFIPQVWNLERLTYAQMSFEQRRSAVLRKLLFCCCLSPAVAKMGNANRLMKRGSARRAR